MQGRVLLRAALLPAILASASLLGSAQQQPAPSATFQVEVNFVDIDAVVTDERGNFIGDLTKDDFELLDDGKPQESARSRSSTFRCRRRAAAGRGHCLAE